MYRVRNWECDGDDDVWAGASNSYMSGLWIHIHLAKTLWRAGKFHLFFLFLKKNYNNAWSSSSSSGGWMNKLMDWWVGAGGWLCMPTVQSGEEEVCKIRCEYGKSDGWRRITSDWCHNWAHCWCRWGCCLTPLRTSIVVSICLIHIHSLWVVVVPCNFFTDHHLPPSLKDPARTNY